MLRSGRPLAVLMVAGMLLAPPPTAAQDELPADPPAVGLRVTLALALGEHALLLGDVVRSALADAPDFEAAAGALEANSADIIGAIESVYGAEAGAAFAEQWNRHVASIIDYSRAVAAGDADAAALANQQLERYVDEFTALLTGAMPVLPSDTVHGLIGEHVQQLEHVASLEAANFSGAYTAMRDTYHHMFDVSDGLTFGILTQFPDRFPGRAEAFGGATSLRVGLNRLLGEHTYLASFAMRAILRGSTDVAAIADALAANSAELRVTIADIYGAEAGSAFGTVWDGHVTAYVDYVSALAADDEAATEAALQALAEYRSEFSAYVAGANPFLPADALEALLAEHTTHLTAQADAYASGDAEESYAIGRAGYGHAGELGAHLAAAIADQFPVLFPDTALRAVDERPASASPSLVIALVGLLIVGATWRGPHVVRVGRRFFRLRAPRRCG